MSASHSAHRSQLLGTDSLALSPELSLFDPPPVQFAIAHSQYVNLLPVNGITENSPIEFSCLGSGDFYIDLSSTRLNVHFKVHPNIDATKNLVSISNLSVASLFQDVQLTIAEQLIEGGHFLYGYKAMFLTLLEYGKNAQSSVLIPWGFYKDTAGQLDSVQEGNAGAVSRRALTADGKTAIVSGPLFLDLFRQPRFLLSKTGFRLKLVPAPHRFVIHAAAVGENALQDYTIKISKIELIIRQVLPSASVLAGHMYGLKSHNAVYAFNSMQMVTYTIAAGSTSHSREHLFQGFVPKLVILGLVTNRALNGDVARNPFNFAHHGLSFMSFSVNGDPVPSQPLQMDLSTSCIEEYSYLIQQLGLYMQNTDIGFRPTEYSNGYAIFVHNLSSNTDIGNTTQLLREGVLRLDLRFKAATTEVLNVVIGGLFDRSLQLTELRDIVQAVNWK